MMRAVTDQQSMKRALAAALLARLDEELATMRRAAKDAREAATHEEAKPENDKDTRALEASYLAGAQAARVRDLEGAKKAIEGMALLDLRGRQVQTSALVVLEDDDGARSTYFVAPFGGGLTVTAGTTSALVITPQSPLGRALLGHTEGEVVELRGKGPARDLSIVAVS